MLVLVVVTGGLPVVTVLVLTVVVQAALKQWFESTVPLGGILCNDLGVGVDHVGY